MNSQNKHLNHDDIDLLLPWYVNGTLDESDRDVVERHLADCGECRDNLGLLREIRDGVKQGSATPITPSRFDDLLDSIDEQVPQGRWLASWPGLAMAASAAVLLIAAALVIGNWYPPAQDPVRFETATSSGRQSPLDYVVDVQFEQGVPLLEQERVLREIGATEFSATDAAGGYRAVVRLQATSLQALEQYTQEVAARGDIKSVSVVALQFPVR